MATKKIISNRKQFNQLKSIFEKNKDLEYLVWEEDNSNGIGSVIKLKFDDKEIDATDVDSW